MFWSRLTGKGPLSDHSTNSFEGHFVHVGGSNMIIDGPNQPKIARIETSRFIPSQEPSDKCNVVFYFYNLGMPLAVGNMSLILVYV